VPARVTEIAAVAVANRRAASGAMPSASATASPPLNASPAPVVSTAGPRVIAGTWKRVRRRTRRTPASPSVTMQAFATPRARMRRAASVALVGSVTSMPLSADASVSLGVT
jgi:hypothetical protein